MRFYLKPPYWKEDGVHRSCPKTWEGASLCGYFHFGLVGTNKIRGDSKYPSSNWSIQGWYWPMGLSIWFYHKHFCWYSKRYMDLKSKGVNAYKDFKVHWWGIFLP